MVHWTRPPSRTRYLRPRKEEELWDVKVSNFLICCIAFRELWAQSWLEFAGFVAELSSAVLGFPWSLELLPATSAFGLGGRVQYTISNYLKMNKPCTTSQSRRRGLAACLLAKAVAPAPYFYRYAPIGIFIKLNYLFLILIFIIASCKIEIRVRHK